jgi:hypothetical protein
MIVVVHVTISAYFGCAFYAQTTIHDLGRAPLAASNVRNSARVGSPLSSSPYYAD